MVDGGPPPDGRLLFGLLLALVLVQRFVELSRARAHAVRLLARGGVEHGRAHYPALVAAHVAFYAMWTVEVIARSPPADLWTAACLAVFALVEVGRLWVTAALGPRWTTRIVVLPGLPLVRRGPYRFLSHPNYVIVVLEIAILAAAFRAWWTLAASLALQAVVLTIRIRAEHRALGLGR